MITETRHRARRHLARKVRRLRLLRGWSQEVLAELCGLHRTYIGAVERAERNISLDNIEKLSEALGVTIYELLSPDAGTGEGASPAMGRIEEYIPAYVYAGLRAH